MLHLIEKLLPASVHRVGLRLAYRLRHRWRLFRRVPITGCAVIVTDLNGDILMLRHSYGPPVWGLPGGGVFRGENPLAAASRELVEELSLENTQLRPVSQVKSTISGSPLTVHLFSMVSDAHPMPDRREVIEARFFPPHSLPEPMSNLTRQSLEIWREVSRPAS